MNYYLIETGTNETWEIIGGIYIIAAENEDKAKELCIEQIKNSVYNEVETIDKITLINALTSSIIFSSEPIIE